MSEITVGLVVRLKSGGPRMTVSEVKTWNGKITAYCDWFEGSNTKSNGFPLTSLEVVVEEAASSVDYSPSEGGPQGWMR